jgi:hypothetical protein
VGYDISLLRRVKILNLPLESEEIS